MPGYDTRKLDVRVGRKRYRIRALSDHMQYADPDGAARRAGICSASWSLFGQLWPASQALAKALKHIDIHDRRIIELGCGLALPSLLLRSRGADVTASDHHPLSRAFLDYNAALNRLQPIPYRDLPWTKKIREPGQYDLIVGSDVLYERNHADMLAELIGQLAAPIAKVMITCPGRGYRNRFSRLMARMGFELTAIPLAFSEEESAPYRGRLLSYRRGL